MTTKDTCARLGAKEEGLNTTSRLSLIRVRREVGEGVYLFMVAVMSERFSLKSFPAERSRSKKGVEGEACPPTA